MSDILIAFGLSAVLAAFFKKLKMPLIVGFLVAGLLIGANHFGKQDSYLIGSFAEYGAAFLMMAVGLEINFKHFEKIGGTIVWLAFAQVILFFSIAYLMLTFFGYTLLVSFVFSAVISFSSTLLVASVLRDKRELNSLHGRVLLGILLIQDLIVAILLFVLPFFSGNRVEVDFGEFVAKIIFVFLAVGLMIYIGRNFFSIIRRVYRKEHSVVFLLSIAWLFLWIEVFHWEIFSLPVEIVGLAVGLSLGGVFEVDRIANWFDPIKDYFLVFLFFYVGMNVNLTIVSHEWRTILTLFIMVMFFKAVIGWLTAALGSMPRKVIMVIGLGLANISELGFVILPLSFRLEILNETQLSIMSALILLTLIFSSILLYNTSEMCLGFCNFFGLLERRKLIAKIEQSKQMVNKKVLIGCHRVGWAILKGLVEKPKDLVILDYDLNTVHNLKALGYDAILADVTDKRFLLEVGVCKAKMIVSTIPDVHENIILMECICRECEKNRPYFVSISANKHETVDLYNAGADLVIDKYIAASDIFVDLFETGNRKRFASKIKNRQDRIYNINF